MDKTALNLHFRVRNLGALRQGEFIQKPLTLFCGPNNSGKTWAMYSLYHCHRWFQGTRRSIEEKVRESGSNESDEGPTLLEFNDRVSETIPGLLFNTSENQLTGARFEIADDETWQRMFDQQQNQLPAFLMPAERGGLHLFFRELSNRRTALLHHASRESIDIEELLRDVIRSRYASPIAAYIDWLNNLAEMQRSPARKYHAYAELLKKDLAGGTYKVDRNTGSIEFKPYQPRRDGKRTNTIGLHISSSAVKSLFGLWFYLEYQAHGGDVLMIDEPELNIHPENQRKIARLFAKLVNAGLHIVISTHSDYIVRELNTLIMLSQDSDKVLQKKHRYLEDEILDPQLVGAYLFDDQTIKEFKITPDDGIYATTFDDVIEDLNTVNNDIYYALQEKSDGDVDHSVNY